MSINGSRATGKSVRESTRNRKISSRMHRRIKIYKYSRALTRITYTGARSSVGLLTAAVSCRRFTQDTCLYLLLQSFKIALAPLPTPYLLVNTRNIYITGGCSPKVWRLPDIHTCAMSIPDGAITSLDWLDCRW